jgi:hypothetical protein
LAIKDEIMNSKEEEKLLQKKIKEKDKDKEEVIDKRKENKQKFIR